MANANLSKDFHPFAKLFSHISLLTSHLFPHAKLLLKIPISKKHPSNWRKNLLTK